MKLIKGVAISLACWGLVFPHPAVMAAGQNTAVKTASKSQMPVTTDVALAKGGTFTGQVVNAQGKGLDGATVSVQQSGREVARTVTNKEGHFAVTNLRGGTYEVVAGQSRNTYRFWAANAAPPSAKSQTLIVSDAQVARGQWCDSGCDTGCGGGVDAITLALLGAAITGTVFGIINYNNIKDIEDRVDQIPVSP
jgi:hypothetical protein